MKIRLGQQHDQRRDRPADRLERRAFAILVIGAVANALTAIATIALSAAEWAELIMRLR
jgi:hypothetical protein